MKTGELVRLDYSARKNGRYAGKVGLIVARDNWGGYLISVGGEIKKFHRTQVLEAI